jgi:hypothetical protein
MDGAPLMKHFDNDHHGIPEAEGERRPPHHRNPGMGGSSLKSVLSRWK